MRTQYTEESTISRNNDYIIIHQGSVVTEVETVQASIVIHQGLIEQLITSEELLEKWLLEHPQARIIDAAGLHVLPGLIDIHCDAIEKEVQPRPNTLFPLELSLLEFERKLPLHGITTMYHSLSLGVGLSLRGVHLMTELVQLIHRYNTERGIVRNRVHLRFEVSYHAGLPIVEQYIKENYIHYLSYMDHSPGQGQYRAPGSFEKYVMKNQGVTSDEVKMIVDELMERKNEVDWNYLKELALLANIRNIAVASHDDDTNEKIDQAVQSGVSVSEFPITLEVAKYATSSGMKVCVGAPNVVRGASHDNNLKAVEAIQHGAAHIVCSDYHPSSILQAIFKLANDQVLPLHESTKLATLYPAEAMKISHQFGSIAVGKAADIIIVDHFHQIPFVHTTLVNGVTVYQSKSYFETQYDGDAVEEL